MSAMGCVMAVIMNHCYNTWRSNRQGTEGQAPRQGGQVAQGGDDEPVYDQVQGQNTTAAAARTLRGDSSSQSTPSTSSKQGVFNRAFDAVSSKLPWGRRSGSSGRDNTEMKTMARNTPPSAEEVNQTSNAGRHLQNQQSSQGSQPGQAQNKQLPKGPPQQQQQQQQVAQASVPLSELRQLAEGDPQPTEVDKITDSLRKGQVAISKSLNNLVQPLSVPQFYSSMREMLNANPKRSKIDNVPFPYLYQDWYNKQLPIKPGSAPVLLLPAPTTDVQDIAQADSNVSMSPPSSYYSQEDDCESDYLEPVPYPDDPPPPVPDLSGPPTTQAPLPPLTSSPPALFTSGARNKSGGRGGKAKASCSTQSAVQRPTTRRLAAQPKGKPGEKKNLSPQALKVTERLTRSKTALQQRCKKSSQN